MARWLTRIGAAISFAAVVVGIWLQALTNQLPGIEGRLLYILEALLAFGIGMVVVAAGQILEAMQSYSSV